MTRLALALAAALMLSAPCTPAYARPAGDDETRTRPSSPVPPAEAPPLCAPLRTHAAYLLSRWGERPFAPGTVGRAIVILFINPRRGTWTLIRVVGPDKGCAVGAGRLPAPPKARPKPKPLRF